MADIVRREVGEAKGDILTELRELRSLTQREFLSLFNRDQRLAESHCPNVFAVLPKDGKRWLDNVLGQKMVLQLYCQAPGAWHPTAEGGEYEIKRPGEWLSSIDPYIVKLAKVIKYAAPVAGAAASLYAGPIAAVTRKGIADKLAKQVKLMEELAKKIRHSKDLAAGELREDIGAREGPQRIEGAGLRALRRLLDEVDADHHRGGLKKILTPEGHYLWLCQECAKEYIELGLRLLHCVCNDICVLSALSRGQACGSLYRTTAMVLLAELSPALLTAFTWYSSRVPVGSFFRAIWLFIFEAIWAQGPKAASPSPLDCICLLCSE
jgi:hypothetical protein